VGHATALIRRHRYRVSRGNTENRCDLAHAWHQHNQRLNQFTNAALTAA
jgi:hypothetical protein